jgi:hypothetical protein
VFRRRGRESADTEASEPAEDVDESLQDGAGSDDDGAAAEATPAATSEGGPWDSDEAPDDGLDRLDLGGMRVPIAEGMELRVDVSPEGQVIAATMVAGDSAMQVNAFAAPRTAGIWAEVADEIRESLEAGGGSAETVTGPLGLELRAQVPQEVPGQGVALAPARFLGADGPRWFLRGLLSGPAAVDADQAEPFERMFRSVVVVRGKDAMAPRDPLPLRLPTDVLVPGDVEATDESLDPFERGPEITEIH